MNVATRLMTVFQQGLLTLQKLKTGGVGAGLKLSQGADATMRQLSRPKR